MLFAMLNGLFLVIACRCKYIECIVSEASCAYIVLQHELCVVIVEIDETWITKNPVITTLPVCYVAYRDCAIRSECICCLLWSYTTIVVLISLLVNIGIVGNNELEAIAFGIYVLETGEC